VSWRKWDRAGGRSNELERFLTSSTRAGSTVHTRAHTALAARMAGFAELGLSSWLVEQCRQMGLKQPTPVQLGCIPAILEGECGLVSSGGFPATVASLAFSQLFAHAGPVRQGAALALTGDPGFRRTTR